MAEQAINTIYQLGEQPDILCTELIKTFTKRVFTTQPSQPANEDVEMNDGDSTVQPADQRSRAGSIGSITPEMAVADRVTGGEKPGDMGNAFHLSQLVFLVGHIALKHIVHLELVEREWKRRKDEATKGKHIYSKNSILEADVDAAEQKPTKGSKAQDDIEQVAGNAEDEIGDTINGIRERELLYGEKSLLSLYGPMIVHICGTPKVYKVRVKLALNNTRINYPSAEPNVKDRCYACSQQIDVCQLTILREQSYAPLQDHGNVAQSDYKE
jgi:condensin complex subunit 1